MSSEQLPLIVAQYELHGHPTRTEHWNLVLLASRTSVHIFEVRGNTDSYTYVPDFNAPLTLNNVTNFRGGCHVGDISIESLEVLKERLREIPIVRLDPAWDCQVWVMEGIKLLKEDGLVFSKVNEAYVRGELGLDMERWQQADDTVDERLLADNSP